MWEYLLLDPVPCPARLAAEPGQPSQDAPPRLRLRPLSQVEQQADQLVASLRLLSQHPGKIDCSLVLSKHESFILRDYSNILTQIVYGGCRMGVTFRYRYDQCSGVEP